MGVNHQSIWNTPNLTQALEAEWKAGRSITNIAAVLSAQFNVEMTRNAVVGKVHRLGLPRRRDSYEPVHTPKPKRIVVVKLPKPVKALPMPPSTVIDFGKKELVDLNPADCRFICSDGLFCAEPKEGDTSYCSGHGNVVFWRPTDRKFTPSELARSCRKFM